jgi:hypothetical protein
MLVSFSVNASNSALNLNIPTSPSSYASDQIRAGDLDCRMAIGSSTNVEFGVVGMLGQNDPYNTNLSVNPDMYDPNGLDKDIGVYARITIPIGAPKERLNCNALYKLELERRRLEVMKLKQEIQNLRQLQFEEK